MARRTQLHCMPGHPPRKDNQFMILVIFLLSNVFLVTCHDPHQSHNDATGLTPSQPMLPPSPEDLVDGDAGSSPLLIRRYVLLPPDPPPTEDQLIPIVLPTSPPPPPDRETLITWTDNPAEIYPVRLIPPTVEGQKPQFQIEGEPDGPPPPVALLFTTIKTGKAVDGLRATIQMNVLKMARVLMPEIQIVLFTDDPNWQKIALQHGVHAERVPKSNRYGLPFLRHMYVRVEDGLLHPKTPFYGYFNSDILFDKPSLLATLFGLLHASGLESEFQSIRRFTQTTRQPRNNILYTLKPNQTACAASSSSPTSPPSSTTPCSTASSSPIPTTPPPPLPPLISDAQYASMLAESSEASDPQQGGRSRQVGPIMKKMLIVGRRTNVDMRDFLDRGEFVPPDGYAPWFEHLARHGHLFTNQAQDYFIVTRDAIPWRDPQVIPDFVIARVAFDNWLVHYGHMRRRYVSLVDASQTLHALHQSGKDGDYASHRISNQLQHSDAVWNIVRGRHRWDLGRTYNARYKTVWNPQLRDAALLKMRETGKRGLGWRRIYMNKGYDQALVWQSLKTKPIGQVLVKKRWDIVSSCRACFDEDEETAPDIVDTLKHKPRP